MGEFVTVGRADEVPESDMTAFDVGPRQIAVARVDGAFYAFDDTCTHAACSLAEGDLEEGTVVCPCHYGVFDLATGAVVDGPPPQPVGVYPVRVVEGKLQVEV
jgi:3-phenylpropionate/trans-cinnamate dioxygenase ferredoxin subunit